MDFHHKESPMRSFDRRRVITWTVVDLMPTAPSRTNFGGVFNEITKTFPDSKDPRNDVDQTSILRESVESVSNWHRPDGLCYLGSFTVLENALNGFCNMSTPLFGIQYVNERSSQHMIFGTIVNLTWSWWRHQMETFSALLAFDVGNSPVTGEFPTQRPVTRSFDNFFYLCLNQ